jgi:hypothetical protein
MWLATLATATPGVTPMKINNGRHQEAAADAEHPRDESDGEPHSEDEEDVDGQVGNRKVDLHGRIPAGSGPMSHNFAGSAAGARLAKILGR